MYIAMDTKIRLWESGRATKRQKINKAPCRWFVEWRARFVPRSAGICRDALAHAGLLQYSV